MVYDNLHITKYGVGCLGNINAHQDKLTEKLYKMWSHIMARCYNTNNEKYPIYGAMGVTVCEEWHRFEYFARDARLLPGYNNWAGNPHGWQLDKDILQSDKPKNERIYSKETCQFIPTRLNCQQKSKDNKGKFEYFGVMPHGKKYAAYIRDDHQKHFTIGVYETIELAAIAYNDYISIYYPYLMKNNVPYMTHKEIRAADLYKREMCKIVNKEFQIAAKEYITPADIWKKI